jgi:hypothetical protein
MFSLCEIASKAIRFSAFVGNKLFWVVLGRLPITVLGYPTCAAGPEGPGEARAGGQCYQLWNYRIDNMSK